MRDTALRYGGFADEVGEFMKPYLGEVGRRAGYGISGVYCLVDLFLTARQMNEKGQDLPAWERRKKVAAELFDLSFFHAVATMSVPPLLIGKVVSWAQKHLSPDHPTHYKRAIMLLQQGSGKWMTDSAAEHIIRKRLYKPVPALIGLAMVPLVAHPFDKLMETVQDWTTRLLFKKHRLVKQPGPMIIQTNKDGSHKVTQLPESWQSVPRKDYWAPKDQNGKPLAGFHSPAYHTSTHARCKKDDHLAVPDKTRKETLKQPKHFQSAFGEW